MGRTRVEAAPFQCRVSYTEIALQQANGFYPELPIIYPSPRHSFDVQMNLQVYSKLDIWEFEQEYRTHKFNYYGLSNHERKQLVPSDAYKEIILGAAMPNDIVEGLLNSLPKELAHVEVKKAKIVGDEIIIGEFARP